MRITKYGTRLDLENKCILVKEKSVNYPESTFTSPENIYRLLCDVFQHNRQTEEYLYLLCFNAKMKLQGIFEISHGSVNATICSPREIFQKALLCNASAIVLAHNHPSGNPTPSQQDFATYNKIKKAAELMEISLIDNIIVGESYYSFAEHMEKNK